MTLLLVDLSQVGPLDCMVLTFYEVGPIQLGICFILYVDVPTVYVCVEEYDSSLKEKLPLIIGSAAAGVVFLISVIVLIIVCNR